MWKKFSSIFVLWLRYEARNLNLESYLTSGASVVGEATATSTSCSDLSEAEMEAFRFEVLVTAEKIQ